MRHYVKVNNVDITAEVDEAYKRGRDEGFDEAHCDTEAMAEQYDDGYRTGYDVGFKDGKDMGYEQGYSAHQEKDS